MPLPSPLELASLEERGQAEMTALIAREFQLFADGSMSFSGEDSWSNQACGVGFDGPVTDDDLDGFVEFYTSRGVEPRIEICSMADASLVTGLAKRELELKFAELFIDAGERGVAELKEALDRREWDSVRKVAHRTKGAIGTLATPKLLELLDTLQYLTDSTKLPEPPARIAVGLQDDFDRAVGALRAKLEKP